MTTLTSTVSQMSSSQHLLSTGSHRCLIMGSGRPYLDHGKRHLSKKFANSGRLFFFKACQARPFTRVDISVHPTSTFSGHARVKANRQEERLGVYPTTQCTIHEHSSGGPNLGLLSQDTICGLMGVYIKPNKAHSPPSPYHLCAHILCVPLPRIPPSLLHPHTYQRPNPSSVVGSLFYKP